VKQSKSRRVRRLSGPVRRWIASGPAFLASLSFCAGVAFAQEGGVQLTQQTQFYVFETAVVVLLFGGALFAVCKSSRRN
jgi:hypothetical protein